MLVTGASGFIGSRLLPVLLRTGRTVVATTRDADHRFPPGVTPLHWDGTEPLQVPGAIDGIINLAGEPVIGKRWSEKQRKRLWDSRVVLTHHLAEFVRRKRPEERPGVMISASAVGYYGIWPVETCPESAPAGADFLARLCAAWEHEAYNAPARVLTLRLGHVLGRNGGYLGKLLPLARLGLAGPLGSGLQPMPWVHIDDVCGAILWALSNPQAAGPYNLVSPGLIPHQRDFVNAMNRHMRIPSVAPVPMVALRFRFGDVASVMVGGQFAPPIRLEAEGYVFGQPDIDGALRDLTSKRKKKRELVARHLTAKVRQV